MSKSEERIPYKDTPLIVKAIILALIAICVIISLLNTFFPGKPNLDPDASFYDSDSFTR